MFQYTTESIINKKTILEENGQELNKFQATAGLLNILREGSYKKDNVVDGRVYKTVGNRGVKAQFDLDFASAGTSILTNAGMYRFEFYLKMNNKYLSDWAEANWYPFAKPILIEFSVAEGETAETTAKHLAALIKEAVPYNNVFAIASATGSKLTVKLTDAYAHISNVTLQYYSNTMCESCLGDYLPIAIPEGNLVISENKEPFATGAWIQENLRFPSYPNVRYAGMFEDERPDLGAVYTQYTFETRVRRNGLGGLSAVNQFVESVTRHVYYVKNDIVADFEAAIETAFGDCAIVSQFAANIVSANTIANDSQAVQLVGEVIPENPSVTLTWSITKEDGTSTTAPAGVTLSTSGELKAESTAVAETEFYVTAKPSNDNYASVTKKFKVVEA